MSESPNPYQSPITSEAEPTQKKPFSIFATARPWAVLAVLLVVVRWFLFPVYADFNTRLHPLTAIWLELYAPVVLFVIGGAAFLVAAILPTEQGKRRVALYSLIAALEIGLIIALGLGLPLLRGIWRLG